MIFRVLKRQGWAVGLLAASYAHAATLTGIQGEVLVSRAGGEFRPVQNTTDVFPGDSVTVKPGALAHIIYSDGCDVPVQSGGIITVTQPSPCAAQTKAQDPTNLPSNQGITTGTIIVGGLALTGIGVGVAVLSREKSKPASP